MKGYCHRPVWSPGGDRLLCGRKVHERGAVVWEVKGDDPAWSPDGKRVVSLSKGPNLLGLALWSAAGFGGSLRASEPTAAAWGVDGASIVFSSGRYDHSELFSTRTADPWTKERSEELMVRCRLDQACMEKELPPLQPLMPGSKPTFSPDGHLAFVRFTEKAKFELTVRRKGAKEPVAVPGPSIFAPLWSPDGKWIAMAGGCEGKSCVYVVELDALAKGVRRLVETSSSEVAWSPDSASIAFLRRLPPDGPPPKPGPTGHLPKALERDTLARVRVATGEQGDVLVPPAPCSYQSLAWSKGQLATHFRCYPPGSGAGGDSGSTSSGSV